MSRLQLDLDDEMLSRAERLAAQRGITIEQLLLELLEQAISPPPISHDSVLGLFSDEPDLMDQVTDDALRSREKWPMRLPHG
jgi:hypothetical protein